MPKNFNPKGQLFYLRSSPFLTPWLAEKVVEVDEELLHTESMYNTDTSVTWTIIKENRK